MNNFLKSKYLEETPSDGGSSGGGVEAANPEISPEAAPEAALPKTMQESMPENWRNQIVDSLGIDDQGDKDKRLAQLDRFSDFNSMSKSFFDAQDKIRSGQIETGLPVNATDEQLTDYREANGIPENSEGYELSLDEGLVLGEADNRIMSEVYKVAHENNLSGDTMNQLTNAMMSARQTEEEATIAQDGVDMQTSDRITKELWGADYQTNVNMIKGLVSKLPESIRDGFENARLSNGQALFNSPEILSFLSDMARTSNPAGTVVGNSANPTQAISDEIKMLESKMGGDGWHKDTKSQNRLLSPYDARNSMKQ